MPDAPTALIRGGAWCGLLAAGLALGVPWVAGAVTQPYSHVSQYISELGAIGAPYADLVNLAGFLTIGLATAVFACATYPAIGTTAVYRAGAICLLGISLGYLLAAFAPCDPGCPAVGSSRQAVHNVGGLLEYGAGGTGLLLLGGAMLRDGHKRALGSLLLLSGIIVIVVIWLLPAPTGLKGLWQRIAESVIFVSIAVTSLTWLATSPADT